MGQRLRSVAGGSQLGLGIPRHDSRSSEGPLTHDSHRPRDSDRRRLGQVQLQPERRKLHRIRSRLRGRHAGPRLEGPAGAGPRLPRRRL
ncbi:hypothetical protein VM98_32335, partial [Streptomyces rubellomurinus subsp. indigoferus]